MYNPHNPMTQSLRIRYSYKDAHRLFESPLSDVTIGRPSASEMPSLDLSPDFSTSRLHARICRDEAGRVWVEDLGSRSGTLIEGRQIRGAGPQRLAPGQRIVLGETTLLVEDNSAEGMADQKT